MTTRPAQFGHAGARAERGFTMIELLVAMAVFSFLLLIIVIGFINIMRLHDQALAANVTQDSARTAMAELVRGVRDSAGVVTPVGGVPSTTLCLDSAGGPQAVYYVSPAPPALNATLYRADNCASRLNPQALTSSNVRVSNFQATLASYGPGILKPEVQLTITVASNNGTTNAAGTACNNTTADRTYCSVVTLTSGAVPR